MGNNFIYFDSQRNLIPNLWKAEKSAIEMKQLQPELDKIKKKYKNPQKQQEEMMKLYQEKGINPASGCLTSLIPLPIMIMLWQVIYYFEGSYAYNPRFFFWTDLSIGGFKANFPLLLIAIVASIINAMLMSQDSKTAWTSVIMSVIFPFMLIGLPVGVFIYYAMNNIVQTLLTFIYNKIYKVKGISVRQLLVWVLSLSGGERRSAKNRAKKVFEGNDLETTLEKVREDFKVQSNEEISYKIIQEPSKGFLGIGKKTYYTRSIPKRTILNK